MNKITLDMDTFLKRNNTKGWGGCGGGKGWLATLNRAVERILSWEVQGAGWAFQEEGMGKGGNWVRLVPFGEQGGAHFRCR